MDNDQQLLEAIKAQTQTLLGIKVALTNVAERLVRVETRVVKLMIHEGLEGYQAYSGKKQTSIKTNSQ